MRPTSGQQAADVPFVLRPGSAAWIPILIWLIEALLVVDLLLRGHAADLLTYLPWLALIGASVWVVLWAPGVLVRPDAVEVVEPWYAKRLPYHRIIDIASGVTLRIEYLDGDGRVRKLRPWNAPGHRGLQGAAPAQPLLDAWRAAPEEGTAQVQTRILWGRLALILALGLIATI